MISVTLRVNTGIIKQLFFNITIQFEYIYNVINWFKYPFFLLSVFIFYTFEAQQYNFQKYSIENGLPRSSIYSLHQDKDGFLWIGLDGGGVSVFDGEKFTNFDKSDGLPSHDVRAVFEDSKGNIWFGTNAGLCKYDFDTLITYTTENGLCYNYIRTLAEDNQGNLWIGTGNGLSIFDGKIFKNYNIHEGLLDYKIRIIVKDSNGKMWVGTDSGINFFEKGKFIDYLYNYYLPHPTVLELFEDSKNNMWIGTKGGLLKTKGNIRREFTTADGLVNNRIRAICEDSFGNFWFGTRTGVSKFEQIEIDGKIQNRFITFNENNGLSHNRIRDIILDNKGNLWFATYFGGIDKFSTKDFISFTKNEGLISNQVFSIFEDKKGSIILGTFDGISKLIFNDGIVDTITNITSGNILLDDRVNTVIKDDNGFYWCGTHSGLTIIKESKVVNITTHEGLIDNEITTILPIDSSQFWIGTEEGFSKLILKDCSTGYSIENFTKENNPLIAGNEISAILVDNFKNTWFGFKDGTISILKKSGEFIIPHFNDDIENITAIIKGIDNVIWIGTDANGLFKVENDNQFKNLINTLHYNKNDGLTSLHIYTLLLDNYNNLWVGTESGLDNLLFNSDRHLSNINHYSTKEGLKGIEINEQASFIDHNNNLWFGTVEGVSFFNSKSSIANIESPDLFITSVKLFGHKLNKNNEFGLTFNGRFQIPNEFVLPYNQNSLRFDFIGLNLGATSKVRYKWKLEGFDDEWSSSTKRNIANYTNLPSGNYTFQVLASNGNNNWSIEPTFVKFKILNPFWLTGWFIALAIILITLLFGLLSQVRVKRLKRAKEALEKQIEIATLELRKEKELIEFQNDQIEEQKDQLTEANNAFTDSVNYAKRIQKAIMNPQSNSLPNLQGNYFIFHRPKDIVSGDFFWFKDINNSSYITASDCTGHGVPGAFMSMIGISFLNQIINTTRKIIEPDEILFKLRKNVIESLKHEGKEKSKDGMDMGLIRIDWNALTLYYAGANNPLYHIRNGILTEIKANKMPIGEHDLMHQKFDLHTLELQKGDMIYIFSDGYADQFGGPKGKKFKYKPFKLFLETVYHATLTEQYDAISEEFLSWKGDFEQIDDVLVIGIRV